MTPIQSKLTTFLIFSKFEYWVYRKVNKGDTLVVLKELELTSERARRRRRDSVIDAADCVVGLQEHSGHANNNNYWKIRERVTTEYRVTVEKSKDLKS